MTNYLQEERAQQRVIDPPFSGRSAHFMQSVRGDSQTALIRQMKTNLGPFFSSRLQSQRRYRSTSLFVVVLTGRRCGDTDLSVGARNTTGKDGHPERLPANSDTPRQRSSAWYALACVGEPRCSLVARASVGTQDFFSGGRCTSVSYVP